MYKRILIAVDGSPLSNRGLEKGLELAAGLGAEVDILNVCEPWAVGMYDAMGWSAGYENTPQYLEDRRKQAMEILEPAAAAAAAAGVKANVMHVVDRYAADGIIDAIASRNSDLVVLASHGRRGIRRALLGSQTAEVLARATVPVLVIR